MDEVMLGQVAVLREQMVSASLIPEPDPNDMQQSMHGMAMSRVMRHVRFQGRM